MNSLDAYRTVRAFILSLVSFGLSISASGDVGAAAASDAAETSFCKQRVLRDYEAPLRSLPAAEPPPRVLPFGPAGLDLVNRPHPRPPGFSEIDPLAPGKELAHLRKHSAYKLRSSSADELTLNWTVKVTISRVEADGAPSLLLSATTTGVASLGPYSSVMIREEGPPEIGTVRVDIAFLDDEQNLLGSYFEYLQVVPYRVESRLRLKAHVVPAGGALRFRLENLGTTKVQSGGHRLQRHERNGWEEVPQAEAFAASRGFLSPGRAGRCERIWIPESADPGLYRIQKRVNFRRRIAGKVRLVGERVTKTFKVTDPAAR
jgi:hypothetical protein